MIPLTQAALLHFEKETMAKYPGALKVCGESVIVLHI